MQVSRRGFLRFTLGGAAAASFQALGNAAAANAASVESGDYRALVVMYLAGGNDSYNMLVPTSGQDFADYLTARQNLAVPLNELIPIQPSTSDGRTYGLHPALAPLEPLFASNRLAIVRNVGNLARPVTRAQYLAKNVALPPRLFSHNDQQAQSMRTAVDVETSLGWGGAVADELASLNGVTDLSPSITLAGATPLLAGAATHAYSLGTSGAVALSGFGGASGNALRSTFEQLRAQPRPNLIQQQFAKVRSESIELNALIQSALAVSPDIATPFSTTSGTARQLRMIARMVAARDALGARRQVFFARSGGWDTHDAQLASHPSLLADLATSLSAFQDAMVEVGCEERVTLVVISEFGRTLTSNGKGTDHGWGGHFLALGGSVRGGELYGTMPSLALDGPDDAGRGRMIPTTATDQFAATIAQWLGVPTGDLSSLFPNLLNFATPTLGFMA